MRTNEIQYYQLDSKTFTATYENKPLGLYEAAQKLSIISQRSLDFFQRIYCLVLDLFASGGFFKEHRFNLIKEKVEGIKDFINKIVELEKYVDQHFIRISGNVEHLVEAEIIGLGEDHFTNQHRVQNAKVIDTLASSNDIILDEHDERRGFQTGQAGYVQSKLPVHGWDDRSGKSDVAAMRMLAARIFAFLSVPTLFVYPVFGISLHLGSIGYFTLQAQEDKEILASELSLRNESMCRTIEQFRKKGRRIYVIAGAGHFSKEGSWMGKNKKILQAVQKMHELTADYLKDKKHVLLVPKNFVVMSANGGKSK